MNEFVLVAHGEDSFWVIFDGPPSLPSPPAHDPYWLDGVPAVETMAPGCTVERLCHVCATCLSRAAEFQRHRLLASERVA